MGWFWERGVRSKKDLERESSNQRANNRVCEAHLKLTALNPGDKLLTYIQKIGYTEDEGVRRYSFSRCHDLKNWGAFKKRFQGKNLTEMWNNYASELEDKIDKYSRQG